ncbi:MAG: type III toxin-antitoxin system ToxN/AbiQ family toxin [Eubacteriales bacterium]
MSKLDFYHVNTTYLEYLKRAEEQERGFTRVPNMEYFSGRKQKFVLGIVLQIHNCDYYVPITSYKKQMPDNFLIKANDGTVVSSLRFNYMFPIPQNMVSVKALENESDEKYRRLLSQELLYCKEKESVIQNRAERTYLRVVLNKNESLVHNSCDFKLLEGKCNEFERNIKAAKEQQELQKVLDHVNEVDDEVDNEIE